MSTTLSGTCKLHSSNLELELRQSDNVSYFSALNFSETIPTVTIDSDVFAGGVCFGSRRSLLGVGFQNGHIQVKLLASRHTENSKLSTIVVNRYGVYLAEGYNLSL